MSRRYAIVLVAAAVLLTGFSLSLSRRDSRDWRANRSRRIFPFPWQDAAAITIARPDGETLRFSREQGGEWKIHLDEDLADLLNPAVVDELAAFATLSWREAQKDRLPPAPDKAVTLSAANHAGQTVHLAFGDIADNLRATVIDGDEETVYGVNQDLLGFLDLPPDRLRNLYLATGGSGRKPSRIVISPRPSVPSLTLALEHAPSGWRMTKPVDWPVDESRLDILIRWLDRLRADSVIAEMSGDLEWFGFGPESPSVDAWYEGAGGPVHRRVEFGKEEDGGLIYAREAGRNPIFAVPADFLSEISLDVATDHPELWRNFFRQRAINLVGDTLPESFTIERLLPAPATLTIEQIHDQAGVRWRGKLENGDGVRTFPVDPPDAEEPMRPLTALITGLSSLRVKTFLADTPPGPETVQWTAYPAWRFTVVNPGAAQPALTLYAADPTGDLPPGQPYADGKAGPAEMIPREGMPDKVGIAFSVENKPAVMETFGELAYLLCLPPYRYQSRRLLELEPRKWSKVVIRDPDGERVYLRNPHDVNEQWWLAGDPAEPLMDDNNRFMALLLELSQLRSDGFVADGNGDVGDFGLDRPRISAIVYSSLLEEGGAGGDGGLFRLDVGGEAGADGSRYARVSGEGPIFLITGRLSAALEEKYH